jgi:hypothetical protein
MAQKFTEVRIPFAKMTFSPDVPSTALGPNEYNDGRNVETDVRGIRSMAGDEEILAPIPGTPTFVTGGFRRNGEFWFIVATTEGYWWASNGDDAGWIDITPGGVPIVGYDQATNITEAWNGTVPFFNDTVGPPMFLPDEPGAILVAYSNQSPVDIDSITVDPGNPTTQRILTFTESQAAAPFVVGSYVTVQDVDPRFYDGSWLVIACDTDTVTIACEVVQAYYAGGTVGPTYIWNYEPNWKSLSAYFMRLYNTPNVGSILIAGNLTVTDQADVVTNFPVSVRWSQAFGLNQAPTTWEPTVTNVANELEVPLRGPALDGFPCNGSFFLCSYWDTVQFYPINYATTSAPILGVKLFNQGRGLLSSNCWANTDQLVYGIDARDIWVFDGQSFQAIGNQRVKNWFYNELDANYVDRVFMEVNTQRNQIEIYYPTATAVNGVPNRMLSYRYDLDTWNAPRDVSSATLACESPIWSNATDSSLPDWTSNYGSRTVVYARGVANQQLVQKDQGYSFIDGGLITSEFRRDNIKLLPDYSGKLMVHRILPEMVNMNNAELPIDPAVDTALKGNLTVTIEGANSVGSAATQITPVTLSIDTEYPWAQINQNAFRVNNIELSNVSNTAIWMCSATTWQYTQVEDDR